MIKKNILPVFLLALVVLLSVFYVKQANDDVPASIVDNGNTDVVSSDFAAKRLEILEARSDQVEELEGTIAAGNLDENALSEVIEKINQIYYLKYTEVELEDAIALLGYGECLVIISDYDVAVSVSANEISAKDFIAITNLVKTKLSNSYKVSVEKITTDN